MAKSVRVIDHGWAEIRRAAQKIDGAGVKVGIRAGQSTGAEQALDIAKWQASGTRVKRRGPTAASSVAVVDYAIFNEFGTEHIPARPFMRRTADTQENALRAYTQRLIPGLLGGRRTVEDTLMAVGLWYQSAMRRTIRQSPSWARPNSEATIENKGSSVPLIDHGVLINSIDFEIKR